MKIYLLAITVFFCSLQTFYSQEEDGAITLALPIRNSLTYNQYAVHPAFSFVREQDKYISITNKREWVQFEDAPQTYLVSFSGRFEENIGMGIGLFQQNYGVLTTFGGVLNFAYNIRVQRDSNLTFGLNLGAFKSGINEGRVVTNFPDPTLENIPSSFLLTLNPGINYGTGFLDFGVSLNNLVLHNSSEVIYDKPEKIIQAHMMYTGYMDSSGFFDESKFSGLIKSEFRKDKTVLSGIAMLTVPKGIWAQVGYNNLYGASGGLGLNITKEISIEYNFEKALGDLTDFGPSHEITLAYKFKNNQNFDYAREDEMSALISGEKRRKPVSAASKLKAEENRKLAAEAKAQAKLEAEAKKVAEAEAKKEAEAKAKLAAEAQAKLDAENKAKEEAQAKLEAEARAKEVAEAKAKIAADNKAKAEAKARADAEVQAKIDAQNKAKAEAEALRLAEEAKMRQEAETKARLEAEKLAAETQAKIEAEAKAKADAEKARLAQEEKDRLEAERLAAQEQSRLEAEAKTKMEAEKLAAETQARIEAEAQAKLAAENKAKAEAEAQAKLDAESKAKEAENKAPIANDDIAISMNSIEKLADDSEQRQTELLTKYRQAIANKNQDLKDLKEENDLSDKGIYMEPKPFKSLTEENKALEAIKADLDEAINTRNERIKELEDLYDERVRIATMENDTVNLYYQKSIKRLKAEQLTAIQTRSNLTSNLEDIKEATEFERRRRIKRAAYDNEEDRYRQDRATLSILKQNTSLSSTPLKSEDFDFGEEQGNNIQILKNVKNVDNGYYMIVAVHNDTEKRDEFVKKAIESGRRDIDFFYDVNTSKYYIYYQKFDNIEQANEALKSKGSRPYNAKLSIVKIEN
ncbi:MAG: PorP/SprF family type IX secretion system membrane protein [Gelidibacter sp.]